MSEPRQVITEHATQYSSGGMLVWNEAEYVQKVYPTAERISLEQRNGGKVWTRKVIVVEDWSEVPRPRGLARRGR